MTNKQKSYDSASIKKLDKSQIEISGSISFETWSKYRAQAFKNINESVTIDGFRKGMIPENVLIGKVGEMPIFEEMAEMALSKAYIEMLIDNKIDAIGKPSIQVTKLAKDNPLEFKITTSVTPEIKLPDYKKIALAEIRKQNINDRRINILEAICTDSTIDLPEVMVESELNRTESQFRADIERMNVKIEDYLKHANKNLDDIRKEWRPHAEKKAKIQLILNEIAKTENIKPDPASIENEVDNIVKHYKDADREQASIYAETVLTNEKVLGFLESQNK